MNDAITKKILEEFKEKLVVRKAELIELIKDDVCKNPGNPVEVVENVTKMLVQKKMITPVFSSTSTFAITQTGTRQ
jgi:hypothetical protein